MGERTGRWVRRDDVAMFHFYEEKLEAGEPLAQKPLCGIVKRPILGQAGGPNPTSWQRCLACEKIRKGTPGDARVKGA